MVVRPGPARGGARGGADPVATTDDPVVVTPYRGIQPFRYADHAIFFARAKETRVLTSLVDVYRGVLLYGDSGNGKSSLVNAGLLPAARRLGFEPVRVRVQPRAGEELVIEQIAISDNGEVLPCVLAPEADGGARIVLSVEEFEARVRAVSREHQPLLVFDQFEEILTLFEDAGAVAVRAPLVDMMARLLREPLAVKLLFSFREDHLGRVKQLLAAQPSLVDQALRLGPPSADALPTIIRGPFDRFPGHFAHELEPALADRLRNALAERFGSGEISLSEVQTVCLRLWNSADPDALLDAKGVRGLLEDELGEALDSLGPDLRHAAIALLSQMVTSAGTRNVVSAEDLRQRVASEEDAPIPAALLDEALGRLERDSKLVRRERRRDIYLYEITSEFLVPWISRRREEARLSQQRRRDEQLRERERARDRRRFMVLGSIAAALVIVSTAIAWLAVAANRERDEARRQADRATSVALTRSAAEWLTRRPDVSLLLASAGYRADGSVEARGSVVDALAAIRGSGVVGILHGHSDSVASVAFGADGRAVASAGADGTIRLWDARTHSQLGAPLRGHDGAVRAVAFSGDGRTLASGGADHTVRLWDARTLRQLSPPLSGHKDPVNSLAFSADGRMLASASNDRTVRLWDTRSHQAMGDPLRGHRDFVHGVAFSPDGSTLASAGEDGKVRLWDTRTHRRMGQLRVHGGAVNGVAFSPDGHMLATAGADGTVRLWDARTRERRGAPLRGHKREVRGVAFSADGRTLASTGDDGSVRRWDTRTHRQAAPLSGHASRVHAVAFSPDGRTLATAGADATVRLWDTSVPPALRDSGEAVYALAFSPDGRTLASSSADGLVRLRDARTHARLGSALRGRKGAVRGVAFGADGRTLASASEDGTVRRWDSRTHMQLGSPLRHGDIVNDVAISADGRTLASGGLDRRLWLWDARTGERKATLRGHDDLIISVAFSPVGHMLATAGADETIRLWDTRRSKPLGSLTGHEGFVNDVAFSPDGLTLASAGDDKTIRLWDTRTLKRIGLPLYGHERGVLSVAFSADGRTLASGGDVEDQTVRLWDVPGHRQLGTVLKRHEFGVNSVAFSHDGRTLAAADGAGTIRLWDRILWRVPAQLRSEVCKLVGADLSRSERARYTRGVQYEPICE